VKDDNIYTEDSIFDQEPYIHDETKYGPMLCFTWVANEGFGDSAYYKCRVNVAQGIGNDIGHPAWVDPQE
jgi:hypothetical protein